MRPEPHDEIHAQLETVSLDRHVQAREEGPHQQPDHNGMLNSQPLELQEINVSQNYIVYAVLSNQS